MTDPAGTVRLDVVVTAPTVSVADVIALEAAACVRFTTLGTATCGRPDDTTSDSAVVRRAAAAAAGLWLMTDPAGTVRLDAVVTAPTVSAGVGLAVDAAACRGR